MKDLETLNLYESFEVFPDAKKILKLNKWIKARKYSCLEHVTDDKLTLKVKLFPFLLYLNTCHPQKQWKSDSANSQYLLDEIKAVTQERRSIMKDLKLFEYFIFNVCPTNQELSKWVARVAPSQIAKYVDNPENLYVKKQALGRRETVDGH